MHDKLTTQEKADTFEANWDVSFDGKAIVDKNFKFLSVNPQWCKLLQQSPAVFLENSFTDITAPEILATDIKNAKLTMAGKIGHYLLHKRYVFPDGSEKKVVLLVARVPKDLSKPFQHFSSRIMIDGELKSGLSTQKLTSKLSKLGTFLGTAIGAAIVYIIGKLT